MKSLEELLEKHPLDAKMENTEVTVDWLAAKCDAMQLKIKYEILHVHMVDTKPLLSSLIGPNDMPYFFPSFIRANDTPFVILPAECTEI